MIKNKETKIIDTTSVEFAEEVTKLKNKYGSIYQIEIADQLFIFKPISRKDYKEILNMNFEATVSSREVTMIRETEMAKKVIVFPQKEIVEQYLEQYAGIAEVITDECMRVSGFVNDDERRVTKL